MRKLPLLATLLVAAAVIVMIGLGVWQLQRLAEKRVLLAQYAAAQGLATVAYPAVPQRESAPLFRRSSAMCLRVANWRQASGRNIRGESGWVHIASCVRGAEGPGFQAVMGWSDKPLTPDWRGGPVAGVIGPDREHVIRLIAAEPPSLEDVPNNHLFYALQWFFFAGAAALIYVLALRRRSR
jgi:surfeit locus 1 family protein